MIFIIFQDWSTLFIWIYRIWEAEYSKRTIHVHIAWLLLYQIRIGATTPRKKKPANVSQRQPMPNNASLKWPNSAIGFCSRIPHYLLVSSLFGASHWYSLPTLLFLTQKVLGPPSCLLPFLLPLHVPSSMYQGRAIGTVGQGGQSHPLQYFSWNKLGIGLNVESVH